jgi:RNA polymerase sigma-70 factor (ECF subfamily)
MTSKPEDKLTEYKLIEGCVKGDRRSQELLYHLFAKKMFGICLRYTNDEFEAQEVLQLGFIKLFDKMKAFKNEGSFEGYLRKIMVNTAIEYFRKNERSLLLVDLASADSESLPSNPSAIFEQKDLIKLIQGLAPGFRMVFNLFAIEGYSHQEIAEQLGISEGTSKSQLARARIILQERLKKLETLSHEPIR